MRKPLHLSIFLALCLIVLWWPVICSGSAALDFPLTSPFSARWHGEETTGGFTQLLIEEDTQALLIGKAADAPNGMQSAFLVFDVPIVEERLVVEYRFKTDCPQGYFALPYIYDTNNRASLTAGYNLDGFFQVHDSGNRLQLFQPEVGVWHHFKVILDFTTRTYDLYVDGELIRKDLRFRHNDSRNVAKISFYLDGNNTGQFLISHVVVKPFVQEQVQSAIDGAFAEANLRYLPYRRVFQVQTGDPTLEKQSVVLGEEILTLLAKEGAQLEIQAGEVLIRWPAEVFAGLDIHQGQEVVIEFCQEEVQGIPEDSGALRFLSSPLRLGLLVVDGEEKREVKELSVPIEVVCTGETNLAAGAYLFTESEGWKFVDGVIAYEGGFMRYRTGLLGTLGVATVQTVYQDLEGEESIKATVDILASRQIWLAAGDYFEPDRPMTRGEFVAALQQAVNSPGFENLFGTDSQEGDQNVISRQEAAYLLLQAYEFLTDRRIGDLVKFVMVNPQDLSQVEPQWRDAVSAATFLEIVELSDRRFLPKEPVTRAEGAKMFLALLEASRQIQRVGEEFSYFTLVSHPLLYEAYYKSPNLNVGITASGAYGVNVAYDQGQSTRWYIEEQRVGYSLIQAGVFRKIELGNDLGAIDLGWRAFQWGFEQQAADGSFPGTGDAYHSTSFFLDAVARALLLQRQSTDPAYLITILRYLPKLYGGAKYLAMPSELGAYRATGALDRFTHRYFFLATVFGFTAELTNDAELASLAEELAWEGISKQTAEGVLPERGGYDFGYQAVAIEAACRYYTVCRDPHLRAALRDMLWKAMNYQLTKLDGKGNVDFSDSTRIGQEVTREGEAKTTSERSAYYGLTFLSQILDRVEYRKIAEQIGVRQGYITLKWWAEQNNISLF